MRIRRFNEGRGGERMGERIDGERDIGKVNGSTRNSRGEVERKGEVRNERDKIVELFFG